MNNEQQKLESNIRKIYLYETLYSMMFYTPIIVLFYQANGLSMAQIMMIQSFSSIVWIMMEVPSGYFADLVGRKKSLLLNAIFAILSTLILGFGHSFYHFLAAAFFWALAGVFVSGADSAFVYDTLKALGKEKMYKKVWGNVAFYYYIGSSIASVIGGLLGGINFRYPFFAMIAVYLLLIPLTLSLYEPNRPKVVSGKNRFSDLLKIIHGSVFRNKKIGLLIVYSALIASAISISYWLYQPYLKLTGLNIVYFGLVFAAFNLVKAMSAKYSHAVEEKLGRNISLVMLFIFTGACYILMGSAIFVWSFTFVFLFQFVSGFSSVVISDYIHGETDSGIRATVMSVHSLTGNIFSAIMAPIIGKLVDIYTMPQALTYIGAVVIIIGAALISPLLRRRSSNVSVSNYPV